MCGIAGFWTGRGIPTNEAARLAAAMAETLRHRGPDGDGTWADPRAGIALGHRRLAVIDLSPAARQPMASSSGRHVIVFNGEIYNYRDLRRELEELGRRFRSRSDTEVILEAVEMWGFEAALARLSGMFAFALWDGEERRLRLVRDRLGEKPLCWWQGGCEIAFASEVRALRVWPGFRPEIDRTALALYFRYMAVPAPLTIYRGARKVEPATWIEFDDPSREPAVHRYWMPRPRPGNFEYALEGAVRRRMEASDVPVGVLLSGGIDSSLVAVMASKCAGRIRTFSIGVGEGEYDELPAAREVARRLGTEHSELRIDESSVCDIVPQLAQIYDEPFADSSQIPMFALSRFARRQVTVALAGDGGDELFGGYARMRLGPRAWALLRGVPAIARRAAARALARVPDSTWRAGIGLVPTRIRQHLMGEKLRKLADALPAADGAALYRALLSCWVDPSEILLSFEGLEDPVERKQARIPPGLDPVERAMLLDLQAYLPDDLLAKVDRASMAVGLEVRAPLLDHEVVETALAIPVQERVRGGSGKAPLREILARHVPPELFNRPKAGFAAPMGAWLRGPLKGWAGDLLEPRQLEAAGYVRPATVVRLWREHLSARRNWQHRLWAVLMFEAWRRQV